MKVELMMEKGIVKLEMYKSASEHAEQYGLKAKKPLYVHSLYIKETERLKGVGKKVLEYIDEYAINNEHDFIFGHINKNATMTKDNRTGYFTEFTDIDWIKHWLFRNQYNVNRETNDFWKVIQVLESIN